MSRLVRLTTLGFLCLVTIGVSPTVGEGCYVLDSSLPQIQGGNGIAASAPTLGYSGTSARIHTDLSVSTLSRLAVLSGPYESFKESRTAVEPNCQRWGGRDKVRHAAIFFATTLGLQLFIESTFNVSKTKAFLVSAAIATAVGIGKEFYDWKISDKDCFSEQDLVANTGGILGAGLVIMISN